MTLSGAEAVQERPLLSRESKTRLLDYGVVHEVGIDHQCRLPGFSPLTVDVNCFVGTTGGLCLVTGSLTAVSNGIPSPW